MAWTYEPTLLADASADAAQRDLMRVRLELADTDTTEQLLQDEEILYCLTVESDLVMACARGAEWISRIFARQADMIANPTVKLSFKERITHYTQLAQLLRRRAAGAHAPIYTSGSMAAKRGQQADTDRTGPYFRRGMQDRLAPEDAPDAFSRGVDPLFTSPASP